MLCRNVEGAGVSWRSWKQNTGGGSCRAGENSPGRGTEVAVTRIDMQCAAAAEQQVPWLLPIALRAMAPPAMTGRRVLHGYLPCTEVAARGHCFVLSHSPSKW